MNGELVLMPPSGGFEAYARGEIIASLHIHAKAAKTGVALGGKVGFIVDLPQRKSFCPDAAYHVGQLSMKFVEGATRLRR